MQSFHPLANPSTADCAVTESGDLPPGALEQLVECLGLELVWCKPGARSPGSYWGEPEAGLIGSSLFLRPDTPVHSALHESSHFVCMDAGRRAALNRDAGSDPEEESAVCLLQLVLAEALTGFSRELCLTDMDLWGYSFREGSSRAWLAGDARDARRWLLRLGLIDSEMFPSWRLRP
jgi:hypothetical protein